jgi:probable phosphoglycerate mutase
VTAKHVVLWRHGQTAHNLEARIQGSLDVPLDATGQAQVEAGAAALARLEPAALWSSDLLRASASAAALGRLTGLPVRRDARLRERDFGLWEGVAVAEIAQRWPAEFKRWRSGQDVPEIGMETRDRAAARMVACVEDAAGAAPDGSTVVLASHGGAVVCGITALLGLDPVGWLGLRVMRNAHWAVLEHGGPRRAAWRLSGYDLGQAEGRPGINPGG